MAGLVGQQGDLPPPLAAPPPGSSLHFGLLDCGVCCGQGMAPVHQPLLESEDKKNS